MWTYQHEPFVVHQLPALNDNYIYLLDNRQAGILAAIDPADSAPVRKACLQLGYPLTHILNTHHHWDHTDGNLELQQQFKCPILGNREDSARIPGLSQPLTAGDAFKLGDMHILTLDLPGHTLGHIAFLVGKALFCGDVLFGGGCGRNFEGSLAQMLNSLQQLAALPIDTQVYCAHEYTLSNLRFAREVDPDNMELAARISRDTQQRRNKQPTIPSNIGLECATNPFLRALNPEFFKPYADKHQFAASPLDVFSDLRKRKSRC